MFRFAASALLYSFSADNFFKLGLDFLAGLQRCDFGMKSLTAAASICHFIFCKNRGILFMR